MKYNIKYQFTLATLPKVTLIEDTDKFEAFPEQPSALELQSNPVSSTYAIFDE